MVNHYQYGIQDIEQLYPFERDIYYSLLEDHLKEVEELTLIHISEPTRLMSI